MAKRAGLLFNWSAALGAYALGGALWGAIAFLLVALVRVMLELQALRRHHAALKQLVAARGEAFGLGDFASTPEDALPASEARPLRVSDRDVFAEETASRP